MNFDTSDMSIFLSDFAQDITAITWGGTVSAIFDRDYVEFDDMSRESPYLLLQTSDIPDTATTGDLFNVGTTTYKLVDIQYSEPGLSRVILANT